MSSGSTRKKKNAPVPVEAIRKMAESSPVVSRGIRQFRKGDVMIREGERNDSLFLILVGTVQLSKSLDQGEEIIVMQFQPGDFVGLISFYMEDSAFSTVMAKTPVEVLGFNREEFNSLAETAPELHRLLQPLVVYNLAERYRRIVQLHVEVALLTKELERERNNLQETLEKLHLTQNRLIHQEKMATLGQLVAGLAHEINNPAASLLRSVDSVIQQLPGLQQQLMSSGRAGELLRLVKLGLATIPSDSVGVRAELELLESAYPHVPRSLLRTVAQLGVEGENLIKPILAAAHSSEGMAELQLALDCFDLGVYLKTARVSAERIGGLVGSLKRYGRPEKENYETVDLREGLHDTLLILGNRLRKITIERDLPAIPAVKCVVGEINQVWTNIIMNAVEAMEEAGRLRITCGADGKDVWVSFEDSGPGVPADLIPRIFRPNFTTKTASGKFGLGLGLAISDEIIQKHGGKIVVSAGKETGAIFTVRLPISLP